MPNNPMSFCLMLIVSDRTTPFYCQTLFFKNCEDRSNAQKYSDSYLPSVPPRRVSILL